MSCLKTLVAMIWFSVILHTTLLGQNTDWYDFKGTATLRINYHNSPGNKTVFIFTAKLFPDQETRISDTIPVGSGSRDYVLPVSLPQKVMLTAAGKMLTLLLTPRSMLTCNLDFKDITKATFLAADTLEVVNKYLAMKSLLPVGSFKMRRANAVHKAKNLQEFSEQMNALYHEELQFFKMNSARLPKWYQLYEYWDIRYSDATERMNAIPQRELSSRGKERLPGQYYRFLDSLAIDNQAAKRCASYYYFLYELFNKRMGDNDRAKGIESSFLDYQINQADRDLSSDASDLFRAFIIQLTFNHYKKEVATEYLKTHGEIFGNPVWKSELEAYFKTKDNRAAKGKIPPNFVLSDMKDSLNWLRSFKGNVIVLSFWFAGCKPCIEEFPAENALTEKFRNQPVKIISVCVNTSQSVWKAWSERFDLQTINLWANPQWEKTIIEKYDIATFPRYVLISQDYKIAEVEAERPSQGLDAQINALLIR